MVTITSLAKDERSARVALAATLEPDDAVTGRLIAAAGAVETVRLAAGTDAFPKKVDAVDAGLWRNKVAARLDARSLRRGAGQRLPCPILHGKQTEPARGVEVAVTGGQEP